jgi:hypothetical protein
MRNGKGMINIGQDERQHQKEQSAMTDQQDMCIFIATIASQIFDKRDEAIPNIFKAFPTVGFAQVVVTESPIFEVLAMVSPAFLIGSIFENSTVIFTQCFCDLVRFAERYRENVSRFPRPKNRTTENRAYRNFAQILCQSFSLFSAQGCQPKRIFAVRNNMPRVGFTLSMPREVESHDFVR